MSAFDEWYDGMVGFHINSARILDDISNAYCQAPNPETVRKWMKVCWNNAIDAATNECEQHTWAKDIWLEPLKAP